LGFVVEKSV